MEILNKNELDRARALFKKIFHSVDPFDEPFNPIFEEKCVLQIDDYQVLNKYHKAISDTLKVFEASEQNVIHCITEGLKNKKSSLEELKFWKVNFTSGFYEELEEDKDWFGSAESAFFSESCLWAGIISHEWHMVIGGSKEFMRELGRKLNLDQELNKFIETWKYNHVKYKSDLTWLKSFLTHVYGEERTKSVLANNSLLI